MNAQPRVRTRSLILVWLMSLGTELARFVQNCDILAKYRWLLLFADCAGVRLVCLVCLVCLVLLALYALYPVRIMYSNLSIPKKRTPSGVPCNPKKFSCSYSNNWNGPPPLMASPPPKSKQSSCSIRGVRLQ